MPINVHRCALMIIDSLCWMPTGSCSLPASSGQSSRTKPCSSRRWTPWLRVWKLRWREAARTARSSRLKKVIHCQWDDACLIDIILKETALCIFNPWNRLFRKHVCYWLCSYRIDVVIFLLASSSNQRASLNKSTGESATLKRLSSQNSSVSDQIKKPFWSEHFTDATSVPWTKYAHVMSSWCFPIHACTTCRVASSFTSWIR